LLLIPGLSGNTRDLYNLSLIEEAQKHGYQCYVANYRGCEGVPLTTPRWYSGIDYTDFKEVIDYLYEKECASGEKKIFVVGSSLGALMTIKCLEDNPKVSAAVAISPPMDTNNSLDHMKQQLFGIYDTALGIKCYWYIKWFSK